MTDKPVSPPIPSLWNRMKANLIALSYAVDSSESEYCQERLDKIEARLAELESSHRNREISA